MNGYICNDELEIKFVVNLLNVKCSVNVIIEIYYVIYRTLQQISKQLKTNFKRGAIRSYCFKLVVLYVTF